MAPRAIRLLAVALLVGAAGACGSSGTELRDPPLGATAPGPTTTTTSTLPPPVFTVFSPAFAMAAEMPAAYTCAGAGTSPPISWTGVPADTVELAVTAWTPGETADDEEFVHWIVAGLPPTATEIPEGTVPLDAFEGPNSDGGFGWSPPCAEPGAVEQVQFQLHALEKASGLDPDADAAEAIGQLLAVPGSRTISTATVTGD